MAPDSAPARSPAAPVAAPARRPPPLAPTPTPVRLRTQALLSWTRGLGVQAPGWGGPQSPARGGEPQSGLPTGPTACGGRWPPCSGRAVPQGHELLVPAPVSLARVAAGRGHTVTGGELRQEKALPVPKHDELLRDGPVSPGAPGSPPPRAAPEARRPLKTGCEGAHVPTDAPPRRRRQPPSPRPRRHLPSQLLQLLGAGRLRGPMVLLLPPDVLRPLVPAPCAPCLGASAAPAGLAGAADGSCPWAGRPSQLRPERPHGPCLGSSRLLAGRLLPAGLVTRPPQPSPPSPPCSRPPQRSQEVLPPVLGGLGARLSQPRSGAEPPPPPDPPDPGPQPAPSASSGSWGRSQEEPQWPGKRPAPVLGSLGVHLAVARKSLVGPWVVLCQAGKGTREGGQVHVPKPR